MLIERPLFIVSAPCAGTGPIFELLSRARHVSTLNNASRNELRTRLEAGDITAHEIRNLVRDGLRGPGRWLSAIVTNARQIPLLNEAYPDALFIYVHRNAGEQLSRMMLDGHSESEWSETTSRIMRDLSELPARRWCAIDIDGFLSDRPREAALLGRFADLTWRVRPGPAQKARRRASSVKAPELASEAALFAQANHASLRDLPERSFWKSLPENVAKGVVSSRLAASLTLGAIAVPAAASAATLTVTNTSDTGISGDGSLPGEIAAASPGDTITFDPSLNGQTITLDRTIIINTPLTIQGPGSAQLTIDGGGTAADGGGLTGGAQIFYLYAATSGDGGAKAPANVIISGLTLTHGNSGGNTGGAIYKKNTNLTLNDVVIEDSAANAGGGGLGTMDKAGGTLTVQNSTITGNTASGQGGGVYVEEHPGAVLLDHVRITGNTALYSGGFYLGNSGPVTILSSTISGNVASDRFGGAQVYVAGQTLVEDTTISGNTSGSVCGGLLIGKVTGGAVVNSTITGNTVVASVDGGMSPAGKGGGVYLDDNTAPIVIAATTITGNSAAVGGGIYLYNTSAMVVSSIVAGNITPANADAGLSDNIDVADNDPSHNFAVSYSLIQNPGAADFIDADGGTADAGGTVLGAGNIVGQDPQLGALADNGGSTETMLPETGSPVINAGDPNFPGDWPAALSDAGIAAPTTDQRGETRVFGGRIDMGAVEWQPLPGGGDAGFGTDAGSTSTDAGPVQTSDAGTKTTSTGKGCNCNGSGDAVLALLTPIGLLLLRRRRFTKG